MVEVWRKGFSGLLAGLTPATGLREPPFWSQGCAPLSDPFPAGGQDSVWTRQFGSLAGTRADAWDPAWRRKVGAAPARLANPHMALRCGLTSWFAPVRLLGGTRLTAGSAGGAAQALLTDRCVHTCCSWGAARCADTSGLPSPLAAHISLGCFRAGVYRWARMSRNMRVSKPRRVPQPALICLSLCRLLVVHWEQVWCSLGVGSGVLSYGPIWASGALYFHRI